MNLSNIINYVAMIVFSAALLYYLFAIKYYCFPSDGPVIFRKFVFKEKMMALVKVVMVILFIATAKADNIYSIVIAVLAFLVFSLSIINDNLIVRTKDYLYINAFKVPIKNIKEVEALKSGKLLNIKLSYNIKEKIVTSEEKKEIARIKKTGDKEAAEKLMKQELKNLVIQRLTLPMDLGNKLVESLSK